MTPRIYHESVLCGVCNEIVYPGEGLFFKENNYHTICYNTLQREKEMADTTDKRNHENDERMKFSTGAECSKIEERFDLICPTGMHRIAMRYALGSKKYSDFNWCNGIPIHVRLNHLEHHLQEYKLHGNKLDDNMAAIAWNAIAIMHYEENCKHHEAPFIEEERKVEKK